MEAKLVENKNKYQMLIIPSDIRFITLKNGKVLSMNKYVSVSGKTKSFSAIVPNIDAEQVFSRLVSKRFELMLTINSDGTVATQKVNVNGGNPKGYFTHQNPLNFISEIN